MPTRLQDLNALEVSFVPEGANEKEFLLFKSKDGKPGGESMANDDEVNKQEEEMQEEEMQPGEQDLNPDLSDDAENAIVAAIRMLNDFADEIPDDVMMGLADLIGGMEQAMEFIGDIEDQQLEEIMMNKSKGGNDMGAVNKENLNLDQLPEGVQDQVETLFKEHKELLEEKQEVVKQLNEVREEQRKKEFIEKAKQFDHLPVDPEEFGEVLKEIADNTEAYEEVERLLNSVNAEARQSELFKEKGSTGAGNGGSGAWAKIEKKAENLVEKSSGDLTKQQAINKVMESEPELYNEYISENQA